MTQPRSESGRRIGTACSVVLGSAAIFCAGVAGFVVIERATFLTGPKQMAFFLLLPVLVGAAALAALRLPAEHKLRLVMALTSTVFSLLVAEFTLLALESYRAWASRAAIAAANEEVKQTAKDYDTRSFPQFFLSHWNEGTKLYPRIYQLSSRTVSVAGERVFPTSNLSNQRIVECFSDGRYKVYTSDEFGFTNPVLINEKGRIIAGHGRLLAAKQLNLEFIPAIRLTHLTAAQERALAIADNKIPLNASWC